MNNKDYLSQIDYIIIIINKYNNVNIIYWLSIKYKKIIYSILIFELYRLVQEFDIGIIIISIISIIFSKKILLILYIDFKSLYNLLTKLKIINKKRLMIDIIILY